jgi:hypothetical protein
MFVPMFIDGGIPVTATYVSNYGNEANASTYTATAQAIGTAATGRYIVVCINASSNANFGTISTCTIGGVSATKLASTRDSITNSDFAIFAALVPTGTTADIVTTLSGSPDRFGLCVFSLYGWEGVIKSTLTVGTAGTSMSGSVTSYPGSVIIGMAGSQEAANGLWTWTNLTEDADLTLTGNGSITVAHAEALSSSTTVTASNSFGSLSRQGMVVVAFGN